MHKELKVAMIIAALLLSLATLSSVTAADYGEPVKATYLGGSSSDTMGKTGSQTQVDQGNSVAVAPDGTVYVVGSTSSNNLPVTNGSYASTRNGGNDAFIARYNYDLSKLLACTYLGGSGADYGYAVAVGNNSNVYVTGYTASSNFPITPGAYKTTRNGTDAFMASFNPTLTTLLASTYLGGGDADYGHAITVANGSVYITGYTASTNLAAVTEYGYQPNKSTGNDAFVAKFDTGLTTLEACTYFGGGGTDNGYGITVSNNGNVYITGTTHSSNLPTTSGTFGYTNEYDAFVTAFNPDLDTLIASTYFGGSNEQAAFDIEARNGKIYITGYTAGDIPTTTGAYDTIRNGTDGFVAAFNSTLNLLNSTYFGGTSTDYAHDIAIGNNGDVYITGYTISTDLPTPNGYDSSYNSGQDAFLACIDSNLTNLKYGTYYGGSAEDRGCGLAFSNASANNTIILAGTTRSSNLPATGSLNGGIDLFVSLWFFDSAVQAPTANFTADITQGNAPLTVNFSDLSTYFPTSWAWDFNNDGITDSTLQHPTHIYTNPDNYTVKLTVTNTAGSDNEIKTSYITVNPTIAPIAAFNATMTAAGITTEVKRYKIGDTVQFTDMSTGYPTSWAWDFNGNGTIDSTAQNPTWIYNTAGIYTVNLTVTNSINSSYKNETNYITVVNETDWNKYSTALENETANAPDPGVPGFVGPGGIGKIGGGNSLNPIFVDWASSVVDYSPANQDIQPQWTNSSKALGPVTGDNFDIVSLGDLTLAQLQNGEQPGSITLGFNVPIVNGAGHDFVVFENGFISAGGAGVAGQIFAELAYVEVSTDNITFVRFPVISLTPDLVGGYGTVDPTGVHNLVGKHVNAYGDSWGTPFDLQDLINTPEVVNELVDLNNINYVRIIDIPGCGFFRDSEGRPIYDAWLTWGSGGLDLEAVGVIHNVESVGNFKATPNETAPLKVNVTNTSTEITSNDGDFKNNETTDDSKLQKTTPTSNAKLETNIIAGSEEVKTNTTTVSKTPKLTIKEPTTHKTQIKTNKNLTKQKKANSATFTVKSYDDSTTQVGKISVPTLATDVNTNVTFNRIPATKTHKLPLIANNNQAKNQKNQKIR